MRHGLPKVKSDRDRYIYKTKCKDCGKKHTSEEVNQIWSNWRDEGKMVYKDYCPTLDLHEIEDEDKRHLTGTKKYLCAKCDNPYYRVTEFIKLKDHMPSEGFIYMNDQLALCIDCFDIEEGKYNPAGYPHSKISGLGQKAWQKLHGSPKMPSISSLRIGQIY